MTNHPLLQMEGAVLKWSYSLKGKVCGKSLTFRRVHG